MTAPDQPLRLTPMRVGRPWGGGRFGVIEGEPIGELWVTGDEATLPDGRTLGATGLAPLVPLVKVLDIRGTLSVQVHPDDIAAVELRGPGAVGKHECWVVLEAPADASVAVGLEPGASADDLFSGDERRIDAALRTWPVGRGRSSISPPEPSTLPVATWSCTRSSSGATSPSGSGTGADPRPIHLAESRRSIRPEAAPHVGLVPTLAGPVTVSAPEAPFRLDACHLTDGDAPAELELPAPTVLTVTDGSLELAARSSGGSAVEALETRSHWLVPAGRWIPGAGRGDALLAGWRRTAPTARAASAVRPRRAPTPQRTPERTGAVKARLLGFGHLEIDGERFDRDVVIEHGRVGKRHKKASQPLRDRYGHTPLSLLEPIPWDCRRLIVGTGADGALPIDPEVLAEARRRKVRLVALPTAEACALLADADLDTTNAILHVTC